MISATISHVYRWWLITTSIAFNFSGRTTGASYRTNICEWTFRGVFGDEQPNFVQYDIWKSMDPYEFTEFRQTRQKLASRQFLLLSDVRMTLCVCCVQVVQHRKRLPMYVLHMFCLPTSDTEFHKILFAEQTKGEKRKKSFAGQLLEYRRVESCRSRLTYTPASIRWWRPSRLWLHGCLVVRVIFAMTTERPASGNTSNSRLSPRLCCRVNDSCFLHGSEFGSRVNSTFTLF